MRIWVLVVVIAVLASGGGALIGARIPCWDGIKEACNPPCEPGDWLCLLY